MKIWGMARGMAIGYGKANFLGYGKKKLGYGSRHTPEPEMTPLKNMFDSEYTVHFSWH